MELAFSVLVYAAPLNFSFWNVLHLWSIKRHGEHVYNSQLPDFFFSTHF